jgi:hypothetical protein
MSLLSQLNICWFATLNFVSVNSTLYTPLSIIIIVRWVTCWFVTWERELRPWIIYAKPLSGISSYLVVILVFFFPSWSTKQRILYIIWHQEGQSLMLPSFVSLDWLSSFFVEKARWLGAKNVCQRKLTVVFWRLCPPLTKNSMSSSSSPVSLSSSCE